MKACRTPTIQTVTEHHTASTDQRCEYLNGYVTVQHCSFGKPSFLDPWNLRLDPPVSKLEAFELRDVRIESRVSSVYLLLSGTVRFVGGSSWLPCLLSFIHLLLFRLRNCLINYVFLKQYSIIKKQKSFFSNVGLWCFRVQKTLQ